MRDAIAYQKQLGPNGNGYAYRVTASGTEVALCSRHQADGTPRLCFDLTIYYATPHPDFSHSRRLAVEFTLDSTPPSLPPGVFVLIGQFDWRFLGTAFEPVGCDPWRDWQIGTTRTAFWQGSTVSLIPFSAELRWPVLPDGFTMWPPITGLVASEVGVWEGDQPARVLSRKWVEQYGTLIVDDEATSFFPDRYPTVSQ